MVKLKPIQGDSPAGVNLRIAHQLDYVPNSFCNTASLHNPYLTSKIDGYLPRLPGWDWRFTQEHEWWRPTTPGPWISNGYTLNEKTRARQRVREACIKTSINRPIKQVARVVSEL